MSLAAAVAVISILGLFFTVLSAQINNVVELPPLGKVEGSVKKSVGGRSFYSFEGVPYAQPPVGENRFKEPSPVTPWKGIWPAKTIYKCLQYQHQRPRDVRSPITGSEDCLYLNIYTPTLNAGANLDVIVFIHGGAFMFNYGGFQGPDILLDKDVVYVNLNYRLGPLGFLSTEDEVVPGNNGLKDQILALKFIREYVGYFGGNPNSVTIAGNSAGGASVHFHYLMPKSRGLFHKGISQSGTALNPWVLMENPLEKTRRIASLVGCAKNGTKEMVDCLRQRPGQQIVDTVKYFQPWRFNPFSPFGVVVDSWAADPLLPKHPYQLLKDKQVYGAPWIASHVESEGLYPAAEFYSDEKCLEHIDRNWNDTVPHILHYSETVARRELDAVSQIIRRYYFGEWAVNRESYRYLVEMVTDRLYVVDIHKSVKLHAVAASAPTYFYYFAYRGQHSRSEYRSLSTNDFGAAHGDDASYILYMALDTRSNEADRNMSDLLVNMWLSTAKTGEPKIPSVNWTPVSKDTRQINYLRISSPNDIAMEVDDNMGHRRFWDSLPFKENGNLRQG